MLSAGTRLGVYEIQSAIGAGGMGEVYRARDTKLNRDVAIKVLPELLAHDPDRLARFQREAQLLASLNHPNIAHIHGLEESDGVRALVMELVEGPTLAERLEPSALGPQPSGWLPLDESLHIARQIAEALEAAHEQGIVHRDLKPANIKVREDGTVKVLDFGLAKALDPAASSSASAMNSPTLSMRGTMAGVILGTAAYMSPEQARGKTVDRRADIWAFGVVLFEMLTGRALFSGETVTDIIAAVVTREPDLSALPANTPSRVRDLIARCLIKDPKQRLRDIGEARITIERAITHPDEQALSRAGGSRGPALHVAPRWQRALPWALFASATAAFAVVLSLWAPWRKAWPSPPVRVSAELGVDASFVTDLGAAAILSPDGTQLVFVAQKNGRSQLYIRRLDHLQAAPLSGTDGASSPFFSPDGQWVAFFADGKLKKISVTGGAALTLCDVGTVRGGAWGEDGTIAFTSGNRSGLLRVSSAGGNPEPLAALADGEATQRWPQVLPGGKAVLFTGHSGPLYFDEANIVVQALPTGRRKVVQRGGYYGRYLPSGHLVYIHGGTLFAAPFDLERLEPTGQPVPVLEGLATAITLGGAQFAVSGNGTLVYVPGGSINNDVPIQWMGRDGKTTPLRSTPANWTNLLFAPDGRRFALDISDGRQTDVWVYEWARDTLSRLTSGPADAQKPAWTPDGRRIVFGSTRADKAALNLYWQRADGTGDVQRLTDSKNSQGAGSWHPSGKFLAFHELTSANQDDLMILPMEGDEATGWKPGKPTVFLSTPSAEREPFFSPDGRWLAYHSNETGREEVYVRPFPGPGGKWQISTGGGGTPTWSRTRHELFYSTPDQRIMVVPYAVEGDAFRAEKPRLWSEGRFVARQRTGPTRSYDLHPDGERIALAPVPETQMETKQDKVVFIFNFFDELRRLAPAGR